MQEVAQLTQFDDELYKVTVQCTYSLTVSNNQHTVTYNKNPIFVRNKEDFLVGLKAIFYIK